MVSLVQFFESPELAMIAIAAMSNTSKMHRMRLKKTATTFSLRGSFVALWSTNPLSVCMNLMVSSTTKKTLEMNARIITTRAREIKVVWVILKRNDLREMASYDSEDASFMLRSALWYSTNYSVSNTEPQSR